MSDNDQNDLFEAGGKQRKPPDLLHELDSIKGLLDDELHTASAVDNGEIPVLSDVVTATTAPTAATPVSPAAPAPPAASARRSPPPDLGQDMEAMVDRIIDKEMPRIRVELKRVMLAELRLRGVLK